MKPYCTLPDYTVWPNPMACAELEHTLRYGLPTQSEQCHAASIVAAYYALTTCTGHRRAEVVRWLKAEAKKESK